jgi:PBP1b-binding outer membrane lipoprotein LpoB
MRLYSSKFIISILITSILITGCSNPIDEYQKNINDACDSLSLNLEEALLIKDPLETESLRSDLVYRSLVLSRAGFSDYENVENNPYYLQASNSLNSLVETFVKSDGLTLSDEFISAMNKFIMVNCKKNDSTETTQTDSNISEEEVIQSKPTNPAQEEAKGNSEACRIYDETMAEAMQLPFGSPKLSYILDNGYAKAMRYADTDLALNFQILIDGKPGSSSVIFDVNEICDQYR